MTDWRVVYSDYNNKPATVDTTSSESVVYLRKNIEEVEVTDPMHEDEPRKQWKYLERTCTHEEYDTALLSSELVELKHDSDVIDNYTMSLIEEGLL